MNSGGAHIFIPAAGVPIANLSSGSYKVKGGRGGCCNVGVVGADSKGSSTTVGRGKLDSNSDGSNVGCVGTMGGGISGVAVKKGMEASLVWELVGGVLSKGVSRFVGILFQKDVGVRIRFCQCNTSILLVYESRSLFLLRLIGQGGISLFQEEVQWEIVIKIVWEVSQPW